MHKCHSEPSLSLCAHIPRAVLQGLELARCRGHQGAARAELDAEGLVRNTRMHVEPGLLPDPPPMARLRFWPRRDASHGPTSTEVAQGIAGIWKAVPAIRIDIVDVYTQASRKTCVANIIVHVDEATKLKVCDVFEFNGDGLVVSIDAFKAD